jgi:flavin reductase (DIM6/NTAB) family NADH-FMN oxidoreductase RutF
MSFTDREFRDALGQFATGVCVVTAEVDNTLLGSTVSSFNSVSLSPPLVLFSLARSALTLPLCWLAPRLRDRPS